MESSPAVMSSRTTSGLLAFVFRLMVPRLVLSRIRRVAATICISSLIGLPFGLYLVFEVDPVLMKRAIAVVAAACTVVMLTGWRFRRVPPVWAHAVVGFAAGVVYFPEDMTPERYYHPVPRGLEQRISDRLADLRAKHQARSGNSES